MTDSKMIEEIKSLLKEFHREYNDNYNLEHNAWALTEYSKAFQELIATAKREVAKEIFSDFKKLSEPEKGVVHLIEPRHIAELRKKWGVE